MRLTVSFLCFNLLETSKQCINHLIENISSEDIKDIQFILTDNASTDGSADWLESEECALPNKLVIRNKENLFYNEPHRNALKLAEGELFLVINNDMMIKEFDFVQKLYRAFEDPNLAIVGLEGTCCALYANGNGYYHPFIKDYVEGSFLCIRTELAKQRFFNPELRSIYFEDSFLSLEYKEAGYSIRHLPICFEHNHNQTMSKADPTLRNEINEYNRRVFLDRWGAYLQNRG